MIYPERCGPPRKSPGVGCMPGRGKRDEVDGGRDGEEGGEELEWYDSLSSSPSSS